MPSSKINSPPSRLPSLPRGAAPPSHSHTPKTLATPDALLANIAKLFQTANPPTHPDPIHLDALPSPVGPIVLGALASGLCFLEFFDPQRTALELQSLAHRLARPVANGSSPHLQLAKRELAEYFDGHRRQFTVPLVFHGTPFQKAVWNELCRVPFGETRSYQQLAQSVGRPKAVRAVGQANGANRIAILAPCHRIINTGGKLGGYAGGLDRKQALLQLESQSPLPLKRLA